MVTVEFTALAVLAIIVVKFLRILVSRLYLVLYISFVLIAFGMVSVDFKWKEFENID